MSAPEKWHVVERGGKIEVHDDFNRIVCEFFGNRETDRDNAHKVSAAPELLEMLRESERVIRWAAQEAAGRVNRETVGGWLHHADKCSAVISKTEGRT